LSVPNNAKILSSTIDLVTYPVLSNMFKLAWNRAVYLGEPFLQAVWPAFYYMSILRDPGAVSGGGRKSKRARKKFG